METNIQQKINQWTTPPFDADTINEIKNLVHEKNEKELTERFYKRLEFGTGGLRGITGAGTNRMNIYTVGMASQGLSEYIAENAFPTAGVVIARDSRRFSLEFAREAACVLAANGVTVYFFEDITPTPLCSFAIRELGAAAGIVVTASHNPPEYNGYKVYWSDGGQIVPPHDKNIIARVEQINDISAIKKISFDDAVASGKIRILKDEIFIRYLDLLKRHMGRDESKGAAVKIVYSPLHGTGYKAVPAALAALGFTDVNIEPEQSKPDGSFPTVKSPNPEEPAAMERAVALAEKTGADIVLATDPDADRMGVAIRDKDGKFILLNGNQTGTMLEYGILSGLRDAGKMPANPVVIKTIVTTELQRTVADSFNCKTEDVLTGFKWIADKMKTYEDTGDRTFIFGGEESYGYLPVPFVRDKDAVSACCFFADLADTLMQKGTTLYDYLNEIYTRFGCRMEGLLSLTFTGKNGLEKIAGIMKDWRQTPPAAFNGDAVTQVLDYKQGDVSGLPASDVLQYRTAGGMLVTARPSGTEPKIKFYISVSAPCDKENIEQVKARLVQTIDDVKREITGIVGA